MTMVYSGWSLVWNEGMKLYMIGIHFPHTKGQPVFQFVYLVFAGGAISRTCLVEKKGRGGGCRQPVLLHVPYPSRILPQSIE